MLTSITVRNFKSLSNASVLVSKGHFSISAGMNSIGKSSLMQAILMLCQSRGQDSVILNGRLTRLGLPSDVIRNGYQDCEFEFGCDSDFGRRLLRDREQYSVRISLASATGKTARNDTLQPSRVVLFGAGDSFEDGTLAEISSNVVSNDVELCKQAEHGRYAQCDFMRVLPEHNMKGQSRTYVAFKGITPVAVLWLKSERENRSRRLKELERLLEEREYLTLTFNVDEALSADQSYGRGIRSIGVDEWPDLSEEEISQIFEKTANALASAPYIIADIARMGRAWPYYEMEYGMKPTAELRRFEKLVAAFSAFAQSLSAFTRGVCYLGPLRDEPKVVSESWDERTDNLPVGIKGERTASILLERHEQPCSYFAMDEPAKKHEPLNVALDEWASYIGISERIAVTNRQKLGVSITVGSGGGERDLTMVGVGVSQLTPVLTMVLSVPQGSFVMIEQPELHLHPAAQARLADFLLFARPDLAFLVETHSEALVTRMRLRAAQEERLRSRLSVLFFEQESQSSGTRARTLNIDEYGNLSDWPDGFFEATQEDLRQLFLMGIATGEGN